MDNFIYVFTLEAKKKLLNSGFVLLREDIDNNIFIFASDNKITFDYDSVIYLRSNKLMF